VAANQQVVITGGDAPRVETTAPPATAVGDSAAAPVTPAPASVPADTLARTSPKWALVLSGGIARGFAHAGVIQALEEEGARPDLVVGSSMGGLVGALYAAGYTPDSMRAIMREIPWDVIFSGRRMSSQWRSVWPPAWIEVVTGSSTGLQFPAAIVDNTVINDILIELFLNADAASQGDFDRLPVPFRTVGTDVRTGRWVMLDHGSLARACRITCGLPLVFPPVMQGDALLVDGGMSSNLPITPARAAGAERVLAVDVALPYPELDESSSGIVVFLQLWDILNKRGQSDTVSTAAGDTLIWLRIPNSSASDFAGAAGIMDEGYRESVEPVRSWARRSALPTTSTPLTPPRPIMPPLAAIEWRGPRERVRHAEIATAVLGSMPSGPFVPTDLIPALRRLYRSGLFETAWPTLQIEGDSTVLAFEVRERPEIAVGPAFAFGNDEGMRAHLGATWRPSQGPWPAIVKLGGAVRRLGWSVHASLEPYVLDYGSTGWFVRGRYHQLKTRIFDQGDEIDRVRTDRAELLGGGQVGFARRQTFQGAVGWGDVASNPGWGGALLAFRTQSLDRNQRTVDAEWAVGDDGYTRFNIVADHSIRLWWMHLTPGLRLGAVSGEVPADALVGLGGPHSFSGLRHDEWLGRRMWAGSFEFGVEALRHARAYVATQIGEVKEPVSGLDLGSRAVGFGIGAELELPIGPLAIEWGAVDRGRERFDVLLGVRF